MIAVPVPLPLPPGISISWTATGAACVVACGFCRSSTALYTALLLRDPLALVKAVKDHTECHPPLETPPCPT